MKSKRKSGYVNPNLSFSYKLIIQEDLFINRYWDDWCDYRDGFRDGSRDKTKIRKPHTMFLDEIERKIQNRRLKNKLRIRKCRGKK